MAMECKWRSIPLPRFLQRWVDVSAAWHKHSGKKGNLRSSVEAAGLTWDGRAHSAIDDARNTARWAERGWGWGGRERGNNAHFSTAAGHWDVTLEGWRASVWSAVPPCLTLCHSAGALRMQSPSFLAALPLFQPARVCGPKQAPASPPPPPHAAWPSSSCPVA
jgi:hypothetical protein